MEISELHLAWMEANGLDFNYFVIFVVGAEYIISIIHPLRNKVFHAHEIILNMTEMRSPIWTMSFNRVLHSILQPSLKFTHIIHRDDFERQPVVTPN